MIKMKTMQTLPPVTNIQAEVAGGWRESIAVANRYGVLPESIALDPGIGFGKTAEQNLELIANLDSDRFSVREEARKELAGLGELAEGALRKTLTGNPSLAVRRQVEELLTTLGGTISPPFGDSAKLSIARSIWAIRWTGRSIG